LDKLIENLRAVLGRDAVVAEPGELLVYECDGLRQHKHLPRAVVFPESTEATAEVMRVLAQFKVPFTPRGAGTGLSGGALALDRGVIIELARMRRILQIDEENRTVVVQTGVVNAHVSRAVAHLGLHYVPDPSSQGACTIGGNIAENAGGIHCLKYGTTTDHVLGARVVLAGGEILDLGGAGAEVAGYDLLGVFIGSEGTFGIATEATLRLVPVPPAVRTLLAEFEDVNDASLAVSAIIAAGVMPAALEMMDREIILAVEASVFAVGLSLDIGAALLIELDGIEAGIDDEAERVKGLCLEYRARTCRLANDETERKKLWAARKGAFGAVSRIAPDSMIQDAVVPRSRLAEVLAASYGIASKYQLRLANVFHAGDGNLHPLICFDSRSPDEVRRVKEAGRELMETCVRAGGSITGEHGVGLDKRDFLPLIFSEDDMETMLRVRSAFDPTGLCNPGKIIPMLKGCGEARVMSEPGAVATGSVPTPQLIMTQRGVASLSYPKDSGAERQSLSAPGGSIAADIRRQPFEPNHAAKHLSAIVGQANISASPRLSVPASLLVAPGSLEEASEVLKLASHEGWSVVPSGSATWLDAGRPLERVNIIISTGRLNRILDHEPADLVASAQAGVPLETFNQTLAQGGQWLPLDPPDDGRATIGGVVATGLAGSQKCGYGSPRNFVVGMRVVLSDGKIAKAGGRVVKNVAGYDLCKLFTGSYGTLGLIAELTFKLRPRPAKEVTILAEGSFDAALKAAWSIHQARLFPVGIELLSSELANKIGVGISSANVLLLTRFAGIEKTVSYQIERANRLISGEPEIVDIEMDSEDQLLWRNLAAAPIEIDQALKWRASVPPSQFCPFLKAVQDRCRDSFSSSLWQAGIADGRLRMIQPYREPRSEQTSELTHLRNVAQSFGGSLIIESASADIKAAVDSWGRASNSDTLMKRIKDALDPKGILSPGRLSQNRER